MTIELARLASLLDGFPRLSVALLGDLFLDRYLEIEAGAPELSVETGLEAYQIGRVRNSPGALGTVMNNLAALGVGRLRPVTVIGDDGHGYDLRRELDHLPVDPTHLVLDRARLTPTYTKPLRRNADGAWQELNRLDVRSREPLSRESTRQLCDQLRRAFQSSDGLIVLDQVHEKNWGVVNDDVRSLLDELAQADRDKLIFVDSRARLGEFTCGVLKGNRSEVLAATGAAAGGDQAEAGAAAVQLSRKTGRAAFCTCGEQGILVARPDGRLSLSPAVPVDGPVDIVGAGDSATSGIVAALLCGADEDEAADVGNLAASVTVAQLGTTGTASPQQVLGRMGSRE